MYYYKGFLYWLTTVVLGSFISAFIESRFFNDFVKTNGQLIDSVFSQGGIAIIVSGLLSLPALVILLWVRHLNRINDTNYIQARNRILGTHSVLAVLAFSLMFFIDTRNGSSLDTTLVIYAIVYTTVGHIIWYLGERTESNRIEPSLIR